MPKALSRTSKKKKFNSRFPPARIKKIMQLDEEVGKVAAAVPVIISRALELFIESLITETSQTTVAKNAKTMSTSHIKQTIQNNKQFDFLRDLVANVADHAVEENAAEAGPTNGEMPTKKPRGRPRKIKEDVPERNKRGESSKTSACTSEEEEDGDEDEETESECEGHTNGQTRKQPVPVCAPPSGSSIQHAALTSYSGPSAQSSASTQDVPVRYDMPAGFPSQQYVPVLQQHQFGAVQGMEPATAAAMALPPPHIYPALYPGHKPLNPAQPVAVPPYQFPHAQMQPINLSMTGGTEQPHQFHS